MSPDHPLSPTPLPGSFPRSPPTSPRTLNPRTLPPPSPQTSLSSIQGRRSGISTGLGVCFAPSSPPIPLSPLPPRPHAHFSTTSISRSASRSAHSRRSSITSTAPSTIDHGATPTASRRPSRRPSLSHLASFLSGIEHHTRVRNPGMSGGRGVSRSASRSQSRAGEGRHDSRSSSRRSSIGAHLGKLVRENTSGSGSGGELGDEGWTGEEPFLDTAPSSPRPKRTQTHDSYGGSGLEDVDVFDEGDRVGVGVWLEGRGGWARDCFEDTAEGMGSGVGELEVVRRLGEGTYAIVYLVREVLYDPDPNDDDAFSSFPYDDDHSFNSHSYDDYSPADTPTAASPPSRPPMRSWASDPFMPHQPPVYGRNFALKCLCKKDLTDELVEVQRGEAVLHRALPEHEFIVRLYDAYETDDWLFLVLEYCPGADLFYWLEGGNDDSAAISSRATSPFQHHPSSGAMDMQPHSTQPSSAFNTPHHSSALAMDMEDSTLSRTITSNTDSDRTPPSPSLLSSTADASLLSRKRLRLISRMFCQMCAAVQACHEVGIAHRDIKPENFIVMDGRAEGESRGQGRVVVKITDWGLGTREQMCEDFDCGSKPYMAYECRNNLQPTYDPRQADIWSLGLVLLNLLYHRNPWADPSLDDPDFADYVRDPRGFLQDRFEGIGEEVSSFLADRVFCDVLEMEGDSLRRRVTAGEFGRWAGRLVMMMGEGKRKRASVSEHTFHLFATSSRPGQHHGVKTVAHSPASNAPGLLSQYAPAATTSPVPIEERLLSDGSELATVQEVEEKRVFAPSSLSPPTSPRRASRSPLTFVTEDDDELPSPSFPPHASALRAASPASPPTSPRPRLDRIRQDSYASSSSQSRDTDDREPEAHEDDREGGDLRCWGEPETVNPKSKRRKRGARKGKSIRTPGETSPPTPSPLSPASPYTVPTVIEQRDQVLSDLAAASQNLARELSKTTRTFGTQSTSALSFSTSTEEKVATAKKAAKSGGVFGRMKNLVKDGNSDLVAFKQRVEERNASIGAKADTYSAPAKLQGRHAMSGGSVEVGSVGSRGSVGSASWGGGSAAGDEDVLRGRTKGDMSPGHWTSASSRRERLDKQRQRPFDLSPSSSTRNGTLSSSTFDSRNHTPLSSFSSVASGDLIAPHHNSSSISTVRDWRQPSPHPRPYSTSRPPHLDEHSSSILAPPKLSPPLPILHLAPLQVRPKLKDAAVDTRDLNPLVASSPLPPVLAPSPVKMVRHPSAPGKDKETSSKNKLAKMLNSISVFNRSQERQVPAT